MATGADQRPDGLRYFLHDRSASRDGRRARLYRCWDELARPVAEAFAPQSLRGSQALEVRFATPLARGELALAPRRSFPLTGKVDLRDGDRVLGIVTRGRRWLDADGHQIVRFVPPSRWKEHLGEAVLDLAFQTLVGGDGGDNASVASRYALVGDSGVVGALVREQLDFFPDPPKKTEPGIVGRALKKILPENVGRSLIDVTPPIGWRLEVSDATALPDPRQLLASTIMTLEIRRWSR